MPSPLRLAKLARFGTFPETRRLAVQGVRSGGVGAVFRRLRKDRIGLLRDLGDMSAAPRRVRAVVAHPATRELASVGLLVLPGRYVLPIGWAATWASRRLRRRHRRME